MERARFKLLRSIKAQRVGNTFVIFVTINRKIMKQIFTLLISVLTLATAMAQIETIDWPGAVYVDMSELQTEVAVDVQNVSSESLDLRVSSSPTSFVSGAEYRFCWGPQCYNWTDSDFVSPTGNNNILVVSLAPDSVSSSFYTEYKHNENSGSSIIEYCWFDNTDPGIEGCYTLTWQTEPVDVSEFNVQAEISEISPNPVVGTSSIAYNVIGSFDKANIQVYSLVGELIQDVAINNPIGMLMVNAVDYNVGIYFVNVIVDGQVHSTKKMVISK